MLRQFTSARIAIGRSGGSITSREMLDFKLAHARARDAVHAPFDAEKLRQELAKVSGAEVLEVTSRAGDFESFLQRPGCGRALSDESREVLALRKEKGRDVCVIVSNGLSATAVEANAAPVVRALLPMLAKAGVSVAPLVVARNGRVALEDEIGQLLGVRVAVILIGERPGLGSADSMSAYVVGDPKVGRADAERRCISNIRGSGLVPERGAEVLFGVVAGFVERRWA